LARSAPGRGDAGDDIAGIFAQPADEEWARDRDLLDHGIEDPWQEQ
jgi:hypothetical protein